MACSEARLAANRRNASLSSGPKTPEGKARSRANAFKHGCTGDGVILPAGEAAEVEREATRLRAADFVPALARRVAVLARRLDRMARHEEAAVARTAREAASHAEGRAERDADIRVELLVDEPYVALRQLRRTREGVARLLGLWDDLARDLAGGFPWTEAHSARLENLLGRKPGDLGTSESAALGHIARGETHLVPPDLKRVGPVDPRARRLAAVAGLSAIVADQVAALRAHLDTLPPADPGRDRAEEADLALFDTSEQAQLFRRYELATERGLYRALREVERAAEDEVGSFGAGPGSEPNAPVEPGEPDPNPAPMIAPQTQAAPHLPPPTPPDLGLTGGEAAGSVTKPEGPPGSTVRVESDEQTAT